MKLVFVTLIGLFLFIFLIVSGYILVTPEDKLSAIVRPLPLVGTHTDKIISIKTDITDIGTYFIDDTLYAVKSTWRGIIGFSLTNRTQKVVIELEPIRIKKLGENSHQPFTSKVMSSTELKKNKPNLALVENNSLKVTPAHPEDKTPVNFTTKIQQTSPGASEFKTGLKFYKGIGEISKNFKTARQWFLRAAAKDNAAARYHLGIISYLGQGREQSFTDAAKWFEQAAKQENPLAQYNLGLMLYEGKGVVKDYLQAFMWIDRAARLGDKKAIQARPIIEKLLPKNLSLGK